MLSWIEFVIVILSLENRDAQLWHEQFARLSNYPIVSSPLQLGILLHQLLQPEARKLYRNLGFFALSFALVDGSISVFGMADFLAGTKAALASGLFHRRFRDSELFATRGEELGDVLDRVVGFCRRWGFLARSIGRDIAGIIAASPTRALILVFVGIVCGSVIFATRRRGQSLP